MLGAMNRILDAGWRAALYCLHPRVMFWSLLPLAVCAGTTTALAYFYWAPATDAVSQALQSWSLTQTVLHWLDRIGAQQLHAMVAPLVVVALAIPLLVVMSLLVVSGFLSPAMVDLVARRRFPHLQALGAGNGWINALKGLAWTVVALAVMVLSLPLWLIPPLALVIPPLIWGWLTQRVLSLEVLSRHASAQEARTLMRRHRGALLLMGVASGYMGAAPSLLWAAGALTLFVAPLLLIASMWLYTLVFAYSTLWFSHFVLAALAAMRAAPPAPAGVSTEALVAPASPLTGSASAASAPVQDAS
jgi:hypothetical protein